MADITPDVEEVKAILAEDRFLRSLAGSLLGHGPDADDAVQHAWLSRIENPPREPGALRAFLSRIVRNRVLNLRRAERRRSRHERAAAHPEALPSAEAMVAQEELRRRVGAAVLALDEPYRTTIWLRFREELTPREVADRMGVPVETVRTRCRRALERLRDRLDADYGDCRGWSAILVSAFADRRDLLVPAGGFGSILGVLTMKKCRCCCCYFYA